MNKNIEQTTEHDIVKNIDIISTLIYKAISSQLTNDEHKEHEEA